MSNKDLLKEAIAEAKTIRAAAIANAREALEESLTPHLKEMLAAKLQEMDEEDDDNPEAGMYLEAAEEEAPEEEEEAPEEEEEAPEEEEEAPEEELDLEDMSMEEFKDLVRDIVSQEMGEETSEEEYEDEPELEDSEDMIGVDDEEEINIDEILAELAKEDEDLNEFGSGNAAGNAKDINIPIEKTIEKVKQAAKKAGISFDAWIDKVNKQLFEPGAGSSGHSGLGEDIQGDLNEALKTVKVLRVQLQEVNLLNAKLLYVNKVFKASNLTEAQKVNVITVFDKAETVKEVKLVYETVSRNVITKPTKTNIKEHRSFASKPIASTKVEVISEVSEAVKRMQVLAGIIEREY